MIKIHNGLMVMFTQLLRIIYNVLRIYEVRLNEISNYKQMLVGVSCIYVVMSSKFYENVDRNIK
jgi:hypothetical protein